jgi:D-alanine-D-alanine ligase
MTEEANRKIRVGVIFGGRSAEHDVSLVSARAVLNSLDPAKYEATLIGITREGHWLPFGQAQAGAEPKLLMESAGNVSKAHTGLLPDPSMRSLPEITESETGLTLQFGEPIDVIFPVLHGPYGEDGTMQGLLELANIPYVGCGVLASSVGMDKVMAREVFKQHGLPVLDYVLVKRGQWEKSAGKERDALLEKVEKTAGYPCFVKPVNMGSSVGVSKAKDRAGLIAAIDNACRYDRKIMIERGLNPRELEVAVLGNDEPEASVVGELYYSKKADFYDYKAKYQDDDIGFDIPAKIEPELSDKLRELAVKAYLALDCAGMTRVDFFVDRDTGEIYLNEVNTIPGFTPVSMYPKMWEATGLSYPQLVDRLIELALERHADKNRNQTV